MRPRGLCALFLMACAAKPPLLEAPSDPTAKDEAAAVVPPRARDSSVWSSLSPAERIAGAHEVAVLDGALLIRDDKTLRRVQPPASRSIAGLEFAESGLLHEGVLVAESSTRSSLVAIDARSFTERWSLSQGPDVGSGPFGAVGTSDVIVLRRNIGGAKQTVGLVRAVDARAGTLLWKKELTLTTDLFAGDGRVYLTHLTPTSTPEAPSFLFTALDSRTGRVLWERRQRVDAAFANARWLLIAQSRQMVVIDPASGRDLRTFPIDGTVRTPNDGALVDDILYVHVTPEEKHASGGVYAFDVKSGRGMWKASQWGAAVLEHGAAVLRVHRDVIVACADDGSVHVIARSTGDTLWTWGLERCHDVAVHPELPIVYVAKGDDTVQTFAPGNGAAEHATITGKVTLGPSLQSFGYAKIRVRIGPLVVRPDSKGTFRASLMAHGSVPVSAALATATPGCDDVAVSEQRVELTGVGHYDVDLSVDLRCR